MHQDDWQFFKERGFGKKLGFGEKPCLMVIDVINGFTDQTMPMGCDFSSQIDKLNEIIKEARARHIPIIFTTIVYEQDVDEESNIWCDKMEGLKTLKAGTDAVDIDPRLDYQKTDELIMKKYASAFFGTDLISRLNARKIDTLIITGCTTSGCVRATAVDAIQYSFRPVVIEDAVGDRSVNSHRQSLFDMKQKYADVMFTHELLDNLSKKLNV